eukprot:3811419-Amphidinium_carterae.1
MHRGVLPQTHFDWVHEGNVAGLSSKCCSWDDIGQAAVWELLCCTCSKLTACVACGTIKAQQPRLLAITGIDVLLNGSNE